MKPYKRHVYESDVLKNQSVMWHTERKEHCKELDKSSSIFVSLGTLRHGKKIYIYIKKKIKRKTAATRTASRTSKITTTQVKRGPKYM